MVAQRADPSSSSCVQHRLRPDEVQHYHLNIPPQESCSWPGDAQVKNPSSAHGERRPVPAGPGKAPSSTTGVQLCLEITVREKHSQCLDTKWLTSPRVMNYLYRSFANVFLCKIGKHQKQVSDVLQLFTWAFLILCINNLMKFWHATYIYSQKGAKNNVKGYFKTK